MKDIDAFPLSWPSNWIRTQKRFHPDFGSGEPDEIYKLNKAYAEAEKELK